MPRTTSRTPSLAARGRSFEHRHQRIGAFDREALLPQIGLVQEALEGFDLGQALEQLLLVLRREVRGVVATLDRLTQPGPLLGDLDLIEVITDTAAVDAAQVVDSLLGIGSTGIGRPGYRFDRQAASRASVRP